MSDVTPAAVTSSADAHMSGPPPSETTTATAMPGSNVSPLDGNDEDDVHDSMLVHSPNDSAEPPVPQTPLQERVPTVASIISDLKRLHTVKQILKHSSFFSSSVFRT